MWELLNDGKLPWGGALTASGRDLTPIKVASLVVEGARLVIPQCSAPMHKLIELFQVQDTLCLPILYHV